ncbi:hypothetical protein [Actinobacillus genomosp. 1]|uniref:hypothetical protein n=1 Tax=Actinobacillus genomosp. 1 TaxID=254839 RepID=UPI0024414515|nr:hypothetical protein [Actinobacillus genomosp. 1]WGE90265.1 protein rep [Actinobacillus genomosp. 1]
MCLNCQSKNSRPITGEEVRKILHANFYFQTEAKKSLIVNKIEQDFMCGEWLGNRGESEPDFQPKNRLEPLSEKALDVYKNLQNLRNERTKQDWDRLNVSRAWTESIRTQNNRRVSMAMCGMYALNTPNNQDELTGESFIRLVRSSNGDVHTEYCAKCKNRFCICGKEKSALISRDLSVVLDKVERENLYSSMLTLTVQHSISDDPVKVNEALIEAKRRTFNNGSIKRALANLLGNVEGINLYGGKRRDGLGMFHAHEVTYGKNGFHPHYHVMIVHSKNPSKAELKELKEKIYEEFNKHYKAITGKRLSKTHAVDLRVLSKEESREVVARYFSKSGFANEFTGIANKQKLQSPEADLADLYDDDIMKMKRQELTDIHNFIQERMQTASITHVGLLDAGVYYKKLKQIPEFKEIAVHHYNRYKQIFCQMVETYSGVQQYRFSNGLRSWAGLDEEEQEKEDLICEETGEKIEVQSFNVRIRDNVWRFINNTSNVPNLFKIARYYEMNYFKMVEIIGVISDIAERINVIDRVAPMRAYIAQLLASDGEMRSFDLSEYQQKQEQEPRNKIERLKLAQKFFADKGKRPTARPVFYDFKGRTYSRAEFEIEFKAELEQCSNIIS